MMLSLYILIGWCALSIICAPKLVPFFARRFAKHDDWIKEPAGLHHLSSVTPQVRMLHRRQETKTP